MNQVLIIEDDFDIDSHHPRINNNSCIITYQ